MEKQEEKIVINHIESSRIGSVDFKDLSFGRVFSDHMLLAECENGKWDTAAIQAFQPIAFSPASCVFHYGQAIFEGLKAHRSPSGEILLFRPYENWKRFNVSARRMCMTEVPEYLFIEGIKELVKLDQQWIPNEDGNSLYIRPFMVANEAFLGVKPSAKYQFMIITSPTANYYSGAVKVKVETEYSRACQGGIGAAKAAANYAASLFPAKLAQEAGYHQLVWTDASEHKNIEESGTMNIMFRINDVLLTPSLKNDSILPGITRNSIIQLANHWGYSIEERKIPVSEVKSAIESGSLQEAFGIGTAATIAPFSNIAIEGKDYPLSDFRGWEFSNKAKNYLEGVKRGKEEDLFDWIVKV